MGWRTDHILALWVLMSSRSFSSLVVVSASRSSQALIYPKSLSKMRNFNQHSLSLTEDEQLFTTCGSRGFPSMVFVHFIIFAGNFR